MRPAIACGHWLVLALLVGCGTGAHHDLDGMAVVDAEPGTPADAGDDASSLDASVPPTLACDGTTDDADALDALLDAAIAAGGGFVSLPAGSCSIGRRVSHVLTGVKSLTLAGAGLNTTVLDFSSGGGLDFTVDVSGQPAVPTTLSLLSFTAIRHGPSGDRCLDVEATPAALAAAQADGPGELLVQDIYCDNSGTQIWAEGLHLDGVSGARIENFSYFGDAGSVPEVGLGIVIANTVGTQPASGFSVQGGRISWADQAITGSGPVADLTIDDLNAQAVNQGITWSPSGAQSGCSVTNSQFDATVAIVVSHCTSGSLSNNTVSVVSTGIEVVASSGLTIAGNNVGQEGTNPNPNAILLEAGSSQNAIFGNVLDVVATGISLDATTTSNTVYGNVFDNVSGLATTDDGTGNTVTTP